MKEQPQPDLDFRDRFKSSPRFQAFIDSSLAFLNAHQRLTDEQFLQLFTGRLFEELAYLDYLGKVPVGLELLDPSATLEYFRDLYQNHPHPSMTFQGHGDGYVPDGILRKKIENGGEIVKLLEYSAKLDGGNRSTYVKSKVQKVQILRARYPDRFHSSRLEVIFPWHTPILNPRLDNLTSLSLVPCTYADLHRFASEIRPNRPIHLQE